MKTAEQALKEWAMDEIRIEGAVSDFRLNNKGKGTLTRAEFIEYLQRLSIRPWEIEKLLDQRLMSIPDTNNQVCFYKGKRLSKLLDPQKILRCENVREIADHLNSVTP